ncbi:Hypothetical protein R9X50_00105200 [Acrodontium crateriforme]|uniref:RWD domain-containing protein n=1 Tax=Acrodontium crateriforme TaxID=150365 RepID=A0AAQ3M005_9PEZI|nr:Hypothetical protein R9X50_00105200 [Acrodontium crateriforme]
MSEELTDEVTSINSIYGNGTLTSISTEPIIFGLSLPAQSSISLRIEFPTQYPDVPPSILGTQHVGDDVAKGEGTYLVEIVREVLAQVYMPGAPCIFDLVEEAGQKLEQLGMGQSTKGAEQQTAQTNGQPVLSSDADETALSDPQQSLQALLDGPAPPWILSEIITEKKSVFVARAAAVASIEQAKTYLSHLLATDKKVAKATHNIIAWRIHGENGVQFQDCDDDGETAAGGRLLHLLELMDVWNTMVVVTRWYGGVQLGPDRFRIINQTARDAVMRGDFAPPAAKEGGKKKSKK